MDGAHSVGSIPSQGQFTGTQATPGYGGHTLDVPSLGCDFYFSNIHKWGFAPHTSTVVWCPTDVMDSTSHAVVSWHWKEGTYSRVPFIPSLSLSLFALN